MGIGATTSGAPVPLTPVPSGVAGDASRLAGGWAWRNVAAGGVPNGNAAGAFWPDAEGVADMPAGRCFGDLFLRDREGSVELPGECPEHPVPLRTSGAGMGARGSPRNERPSRR